MNEAVIIQNWTDLPMGKAREYAERLLATQPLSDGKVFCFARMKNHIAVSAFLDESANQIIVEVMRHD